MAQLPSGSRLLRVIHPANTWDWNEVLLNKIAYFMETLVWQKTEDAHRKMPLHQPKLFMPDFMPQDDPAKDLETQTVDDVKELLARPRV